MGSRREEGRQREEMVSEAGGDNRETVGQREKRMCQEMVMRLVGSEEVREMSKVKMRKRLVREWEKEKEEKKILVYKMTTAVTERILVEEVERQLKQIGEVNSHRGDEGVGEINKDKTGVGGERAPLGGTGEEKVDGEGGRSDGREVSEGESEDRNERGWPGEERTAEEVGGRGSTMKGRKLGGEVEGSKGEGMDAWTRQEGGRGRIESKGRGNSWDGGSSGRLKKSGGGRGGSGSERTSGEIDKRTEGVRAITGKEVIRWLTERVRALEAERRNEKREQEILRNRMCEQYEEVKGNLIRYMRGQEEKWELWQAEKREAKGRYEKMVQSQQQWVSDILRGHQKWYEERECGSQRFMTKVVESLQGVGKGTDEQKNSAKSQAQQAATVQGQYNGQPVKQQMVHDSR